MMTTEKLNAYDYQDIAKFYYDFGCIQRKNDPQFLIDLFTKRSKQSYEALTFHARMHVFSELRPEDLKTLNIDPDTKRVVHLFK